MDISSSTIVGQTLRDPGMAIAAGAILTALIKIATLALAGMVGRLLNTKLHVEDSTWKQKVALRLVCYAENTILGDANKQAYVSKEIATILGNRVKPDEIQHLLEEAVVKMTALTKGVPVVVVPEGGPTS